jgi:hypothetical protein
MESKTPISNPDEIEDSYGEEEDDQIEEVKQGLEDLSATG